MHYGNAFPAVAPLKAAVNPKLSATGKNALTKFNGVPTNYSLRIIKKLKLNIIILNKYFFLNYSSSLIEY